MHFFTVPVSVALLGTLSLVSAAPGIVKGKEVAVVELVSYADQNLFYSMLVSDTICLTFEMRRPYVHIGQFDDSESGRC